MIFSFKKPSSTLKIISLGGLGVVTENLFVYQLGSDVLMVDCGIGFPSQEDPRGDLVIPDISYLQQGGLKIRGIVLTHGHEDHIGALPYVLPKLGRDIPIYGSKLTIALAQEKLEEFGISAQLRVIDSNDRLFLGPFSVDPVRITHSVPGTFCLIIKTPLGTIFHASDFKFDWTPVMEKPTDVGKIARAGEQGILLLLTDCLRSEKPGYTLSESTISESFEREISDCKGRFIVTTMSSNVSRWKQAIDVLRHHQRKIVIVGRSVEKIIEKASELGYLNLNRKEIIHRRQMKSLPPSKIGILVAGSQAQTGSALDRIAAGELEEIKITPGDKVVFSTDYIPGNELAMHRMIDNLSRQGADVSYSDILDDLHVSGHAAQAELMLMLALTQPKYVLPIGGAFRQMKQYVLLAQKAGRDPNNLFLPTKNRVVEITPGGNARLGEEFRLRKKVVFSPRRPKGKRRRQFGARPQQKYGPRTKEKAI
jgi:ribonuclease J